MTRLIVDASVSASWLLPDEESPEGRFWLAQVFSLGAFAPTIWNYEIRNICEKRGRLGPVSMAKALHTLKSLPIQSTDVSNWDHIMWISTHHNLTIYDAAYLELTLRLDGQLATFDKALAAAAFANGVLARA